MTRHHRVNKPITRTKQLPMKSLTMMKCYIEQIRSGGKVVEARVGIPSVRSIRPGQRLRFFYMRNASDDVVCEVEEVRRYDSFEEMLKVGGDFRNNPLIKQGSVKDYPGSSKAY